MKANTKALLYGTIPVCIWSLSAAIFVYANKVLTAQQIVFGMFLIAGLVASAIIIANLKTAKVRLKELRDGRSLWLILLAAIGLYGHTAFLYYAYSTGLVVEANAINYLWPAFLYSATLAVYGKLTARRVLNDLVLFASAFFGATLVVIFNTGGVQNIRISVGSADALQAFGFALLAAVSAAVYMVALPKIGRAFSDSQSLFDKAMPLIFALPVAAVFAAVHSVFALESLPELNLVTVGIFVFVGFVNVIACNLLWLYALSIDRGNRLPILAYFIPILSTLSLILIYSELEINGYIVAGISLIVCANVYFATRANVNSTLRGAIILVSIAFAVCLVVPSAVDDTSDFLIGSTLAAFFFYSGFLGLRIWERNRDQDAFLGDLCNCIYDYREIRGEAGSSKPSSLTNLVARIVDFEYAHVDNTLTSSRDLLTEIVKIGNSANGVYEGVGSRMESITRKWVLAKIARPNDAEFVILNLLALVTFLSVITNRSPSLVGEFSASIIGAAVLFLTLYLQGQVDQRVFSWRRTLALHEAAGLVDKQPSKIYVPSWVEEIKGRFVRPERYEIIKVLDGKEHTVSFPQGVWAAFNLSNLTASVTFIVITSVFFLERA